MTKPKKSKSVDHADKFTWKQGDIKVIKKGKPAKDEPKKKEKA